MRRGSGKYQQMKLPENKSLRERARQLRKESTLAEVLLWNQLKKKRANGLDFDRQKVIGNYIVDFYCPALKLVIEIDGTSHDNKVVYDALRHKYLEDLGLTVLHIEDRDVKMRMGAVLETLETVILNHYPADQVRHPFAREGD